MNLYSENGQPYNTSNSTHGFTNEEKEVNKILALWNKEVRLQSEFRYRQYRCEKVMADDPFTSSEKQHFKAQNRTVIHVPIMRVNEMHVSGLQRTSRSEYKVTAVDQELDPEIAKLTSDLLNSIGYNSDLPGLEASWFVDGQNGLGNLHVYESFDHDPLGEVLFEISDRFSVLHDSEAKDPGQRDERYQLVTRYYTREWLETRFLSKVKHLMFNESDYNDWWNDLGDELIESLSTISTDLVDFKNGLYAVLELHERKTRTVLSVFDSNTDKVLMPFELNRSAIPEFHANMPNIYVAEQRKPYIKKSLILPYGSIMLSSSENDYEFYEHTSYLSRRRGGDTRIPKCSSYHYGLLGLQTSINITHMNKIEYVVRSIRGGWWVFGNDTQLVQEMNQHGHKIGQTYAVQGPPGSEPKRITPENLSAAINALEEGDINKLAMTTGLNLQPSGKGDFAGQSGYHRDQLRKESQTTIYPMLEDFDFQRGIVGRAAMERLMSQMTIPRMVRITGSTGEQRYIVASAEMISDWGNVGKWDVRILEGPFASKLKQEIQNERLELTSFVIDRFGPEVVNPGDIFRGSNLVDGKELGDLADERWRAKMALELGVNPEETENEQIQ